MSITELEGEAEGFRHFHLESVDSTNEVLTKMARDGDPGKIWLTAGEQLKGKGSRGREWKSVPGNLYASLLLREPCEKNSQHELTFVAALAARAALDIATSKPLDLRLKWPNDLMANGKKCGGILLESGEFDRQSYVIVGMGINCNSFPESTLHPSTSLAEEGCNVAPQVLFSDIAKEFSKSLFVWAGGHNFQGIRENWLAHAYGLGEHASVNVPGSGTIEGRFTTIDPQGYMLLKSAAGDTRRISTADIFFAQEPSKGV